MEPISFFLFLTIRDTLVSPRGAAAHTVARTKACSRRAGCSPRGGIARQSVATELSALPKAWYIAVLMSRPSAAQTRSFAREIWMHSVRARLLRNSLSSTKPVLV